MRIAHLPTSPVRAWIARCGAAALLAVLSACGGGGSGGPTAAAPPITPTTPIAAAPNVVSLVVDNGVDGNAVDQGFVTVTVCVPGTQTCQTINHILVDTGSYGLRLDAAALNSTLKTSLPVENAPGGAPLGECANFVSGYAWGSVRRADVQIGGESASNVPVQVVADPAAAYAKVPTACSSTGASMGVTPSANGILGVGFQKEDCGTTCTTSTSAAMYFSCPSTGCVSTVVPLASQVTDPVALFAKDNNGVIIQLPPVPLGGASSVTGYLVFGIGTETNNTLGSAKIYQVDAQGNFTTVYKGQTLSGFIDSGSNGIFFHDTSIPSCSNGFYCPASPLNLAATVTGTNGTTSTVSFQVEKLPPGAAAAHLGGDLGLSRSFDWGLPFFFGRTVFTAFEGASVPGASIPGPFWAF